MKISARNVFAGTITKVVRGPVSTEVAIRIAKDVEIVSVITTHSAKRLKLRKGQRAHALGWRCDSPFTAATHWESRTRTALNRPFGAGADPSRRSIVLLCQ